MRKYFAILVLLTCTAYTRSFHNVTKNYIPSYSSTMKRLFEVNQLDLNKVIAAIHAVGIECAERVWPGYSMNDTQIYFVYESERKALLYTPETNLLSEVRSFDSLDPQIKSNLYWMGDIEGKSSVAIGLDHIGTYSELAPEEFIHTLVFHELFHYHGQKSWITNEDSNRETFMPLDPKPRYYRTMIYKELRSSLETYYSTKNIDQLKSSLGNAKFWYIKWKNEFPFELNNYADLVESTARYVEYQSIAIAQTGCQASEEEVDAAFFKQISPLDLSKNEFSSLTLDGEAYMLGGPVLKILELIDRNKSFISRIEKNETPLEILFENITSMETPRDDKTLTKIELLAQEQNNSFWELASEPLERLDSSNSQKVMVAVNFSTLRSNLVVSSMYAYHYKNQKLTFAPLADVHEFKTFNESLSLNASVGGLPLIDNIEAKQTCSADQESTEYLIFVLNQNEITAMENNVFNFSYTYLKGQAQGTVVKASSNNNYICIN